MFKMVIINKTLENLREENYLINVSLLHQVIISPENVEQHYKYLAKEYLQVTKLLKSN